MRTTKTRLTAYILFVITILVIGFLSVVIINGVTKQQNDKLVDNQRLIDQVSTEIKFKDNSVKSYKLDFKENETALEMLSRLQSQTADFSFNTEKFSFGEMINEINGYKVSGNEFWKVYLNSQEAQVGISDITMSKGDKLAFSIDTF